VFKALDINGNPIADTYLFAQDYGPTDANFDYQDNVFVIEGISPLGGYDLF
jgi:hypothetical protein